MQEFPSLFREKLDCTSKKHAKTLEEEMKYLVIDVIRECHTEVFSNYRKHGCSSDPTSDTSSETAVGPLQASIMQSNLDFESAYSGQKCFQPSEMVPIPNPANDSWSMGSSFPELDIFSMPGNDYSSQSQWELAEIHDSYTKPLNISSGHENIWASFGAAQPFA
jgi:hypothetical protein